MQTAAELEKRKDKFSQELDFVIADVVCSSFSAGGFFYILLHLLVSVGKLVAIGCRFGINWFLIFTET